MSSASVFRITFLFKKYLNDSCTPEELEEFFDLIAEEKNLAEIKGLLEVLWLDTDTHTNINADPIQQEVLYGKLLANIKNDKKTYTIQKTNYRPLVWSVAAALAMFICIGIYFFDNGKPIKPLQNIARVNKPKPARHAREIRLADGSIVFLNKNSHLDYPTVFNGKTREVYLTGEAYFDIKHDPLHPFLVHTGQITTRVLGTAFNIKTDGNLVRVTVTRGKVRVSTSKRVLGVLLPDQQISYNEATRRSSRDLLNAKSIVLWKETDLIMDNMTLKEAAAVLTDRYGVNIVLANNKIENCRFVASFLNTTSLDQVIKVLSHLNNLNYKWDNPKQLTFSGPGCE
ncbi:FecR family protein [Mucilaginibacter sp. AW1-3]